MNEFKDLSKYLEVETTRREQKREIVALRNQLLEAVKVKVSYDPKTDMITMPKNKYDILINDWEKTTQKYLKEYEPN